MVAMDLCAAFNTVGPLHVLNRNSILSRTRDDLDYAVNILGMLYTVVCLFVFYIKKQSKYVGWRTLP